MTIKKISNEIDWGSASDLIKHEGFYMFGGRKPDNEAVDTLLIIKPTNDKHYGNLIKFKIFKPKTGGIGPSARYMHTSNFMPKLGLYVIYGGRNDFLPKMQILNDMFVLKLHTLEWVKVQPGGEVLPVGRANHCSLVYGTELIIFGGQGYDF